MIVTLEDFIREFTKIKGMGWIQTHRSGPTGIGKTLEDLLGIPENNLDQPDFGDYELSTGLVASIVPRVCEFVIRKGLRTKSWTPEGGN